MKSFFQGSFFALLGGMAAYAAVRFLAPELAPNEFAPLIGLSALGAGVLGTAIAKRIGDGKE